MLYVNGEPVVRVFISRLIYDIDLGRLYLSTVYDYAFYITFQGNLDIRQFMVNDKHRPVK